MIISLFEFDQEKLVHMNIKKLFSLGYIAGVFCAIVSHPADTVVSKLNQEKGSTALEAAKKLGMAGLWKGLMPRIVMIGTLTALQWFIYDAFKVRQLLNTKYNSPKCS